jgi:hypothetical protein
MLKRSYPAFVVRGNCIEGESFVVHDHVSLKKN